MKFITGLAFILSSYSAVAQCPYVVGMLADAEDTGIPSGEGKNEFMVFNTGGSSVAINTVYLSYATNPITTNFSIDGTASPSVWTSLVTPSLISNSIGTVTVITSGSIPANKNVVVIASTNAVSYDLKSFGTDVYVLPYDITAGSPRVVGYNAGGNFANSGAASRYLRISQGATCEDTVAYIPASLPGGDGGGATWTVGKVITYLNSGSSGVVLPVHLLSFNTIVNSGVVEVDWSTSLASTAQYFELEKSLDAIVFSQIAVLPTQKEGLESVKKYSFTDVLSASESVFYRLRMIDIDGTSSFSPTNKINGSGSSIMGSVYPNPSANELFIINSSNFEEAIVFDYYGKSILDKALVSGKNSLNISSLSRGFYLLQLKSKNGIEYHKIAKE